MSLDVHMPADVSGARFLVAIALALLAIQGSAAAQTLETVTLRDGAMYQGELVEKVPNDHVTIKLATGETRRFEWTEIASATESAGRAPPALPSNAAQQGRLGLMLDNLTVKAVAPQSPAERAGFLPGDVIVEVDDLPVQNVLVALERLHTASAAGHNVRVRRGDGELVLSVDTLPASATPIFAPAEGVDSGVGSGVGSGDGHVISGWPRPNRRSTWLMGGMKLAVGVAAGFGTPTGYGGIVVEFQPWSWLTLEVGAGLGGTFGWATAEMLRFGWSIVDWMRFGVGSGVSQNYLRRGNVNLWAGAPDGAPNVNHFVNTELFFDIGGEHIFFRLVSGVAIMLNQGDYRAICPFDVSAATAQCQASASSFAVTPWRAAYAAGHSDPLLVFYSGIEALWAFSLGDGS